MQLWPIPGPRFLSYFMDWRRRSEPSPRDLESSPPPDSQVRTRKNSNTWQKKGQASYEKGFLLDIKAILKYKDAIGRIRIRINVRSKKMDNWLNIGIKGSACWPTKETKINFGGHELILKPATKETEQSVHINLHGITDVDAMTLINRFLSILSWCDEQGMENREGWSGSAIPVAVPKDIRVVGSSIAFPFYREIEKEPKARLAFALYREAITINSIPFSFLSYFKILNIFWKDRYQEGKNEMIEGIRKALPHIEDDLARERINELEKREEDVPEYLYKSGRCAVAHAYSKPIVDPDDTKDLQRLSQDIWIIKAIAEFLIKTELKASRSIMG